MKKLLERLLGGPSREEAERQAQAELDAIGASATGTAGPDEERRVSMEHPSLQGRQKDDR